MLSVKVLGPGCANCQKVEQIAKKVVATLSVDATFQKVTTTQDIMKYPILATPGLVINEKLVCAGRIPTETEVTTWITSALATA
ncbi:MAG: TM0996/MTH895 family glutaredoxin-like protein [Chloroflexi bacterium]|nr:TM0996/MTH895 family glutaredoxin-like protein [Chloroflexota bacterium]